MKNGPGVRALLQVINPRHFIFPMITIHSSFYTLPDCRRTQVWEADTPKRRSKSDTYKACLRRGFSKLLIQGRERDRFLTNWNFACRKAGTEDPK